MGERVSLDFKEISLFHVLVVFSTKQAIVNLFPNIPNHRIGSLFALLPSLVIEKTTIMQSIPKEMSKWEKLLFTMWLKKTSAVDVKN